MSTETKFTPGPWRFSTSPQPNGCPIIGARGLMVAMLAHSINEIDQRETAIANATLIAESPELYEALEALTGVVQSDPFLRYSEDSLYGKAIKAALAVLKKARGE